MNGAGVEWSRSERLSDHTSGMKVKQYATLASKLRRFHVPGETFSQEEARAVHPGLHGGQTQVQRLGDLGIRESLDIVHEKGRPVVGCRYTVTGLS